MSSLIVKSSVYQAICFIRRVGAGDGVILSFVAAKVPPFGECVD